MPPVDTDDFGYLCVLKFLFALALEATNIADGTACASRAQTVPVAEQSMPRVAARGCEVVHRTSRLAPSMAWYDAVAISVAMSLLYAKNGYVEPLPVIVPSPLVVGEGSTGLTNSQSGEGLSPHAPPVPKDP
jgi:hypothetical protein